MAGASRNLKDEFGQPDFDIEYMDVDQELSSIRDKKADNDYPDMHKEGDRLISLINEPGMLEGRRRELAKHGFYKFDQQRIACFQCGYTLEISVNGDIVKLHKGTKKCEFLEGNLWSCDNVPLPEAPAHQPLPPTPQTTPERGQFQTNGCSVSNGSPTVILPSTGTLPENQSYFLTPQTSPVPGSVRLVPSYKLPCGHDVSCSVCPK